MKVKDEKTKITFSRFGTKTFIALFFIFVKRFCKSLQERNSVTPCLYARICLHACDYFKMSRKNHKMKLCVCNTSWWGGGPTPTSLQFATAVWIIWICHEVYSSKLFCFSFDVAKNKIFWVATYEIEQVSRGNGLVDILSLFLYI